MYVERSVACQLEQTVTIVGDEVEIVRWTIEIIR